MTYLLITDPHLRSSHIDKIVSSEGFDRVLINGDLFHSFADTAEENKKMAQWAKDRLYKEKWIFVKGNHDCSHSHNNYYCRCSGWDFEKQVAVDSVLKEEDWDKFKWYHWLDDNTLVSHAGLTEPLAKKILGKKPTPENVKQLLEEEAPKATKALKNRETHWFFMAGRSRGGSQRWGSLTWCDWSEFEPIDGILQIVGHSEDKKVRYKDNNICFDTRMQNYIVWEDGKIIVKNYIDL